MHPKKAALLNIVVSLIFAVAMVFASDWLKGTEYSQEAIYWLVAIWWMPFSFLSSCTATWKCEGKC